VTVARKPQYVDQIPNQFDGNTRELLERTDERGALDSLIDRLNIRPVMDQPIDSISGGELQRVAIAACLARDADFYFLDEITPYLDIGQRMIVARLIRASWRTTTPPSARCSSSSTTSPSWTCSPTPSTSRTGSPPARTGRHGPQVGRNGINEYLKGYLDNENMRIRPSAITFEEHAPRVSSRSETLIEYPELSKSYGDGEFELHVEGGEINRSEVLGVVGPNGIGKSTLAKLFAGSLEPDEGNSTLHSTSRTSRSTSILTSRCASTCSSPRSPTTSVAPTGTRRSPSRSNSIA